MSTPLRPGLPGRPHAAPCSAAAKAYLRGLRQLRALGGDPCTVASVAELLYAAGIDAEAIPTAARRVLAAVATP